MLESELKMLQQYKSDLDSLFIEYQKEYARDMLAIEEIAIKRSTKPTSEPESETLTLDPEDKSQQWKKTGDGWEKKTGERKETETQKKSSPEWAKKLFRKIALATHPDRLEKQDEAKRRVFLEATSAMEEGEFNKLLGFALQLDLPSENDDVSVIPMLQDRIKSVQEEVRTIEERPEWLWGEGFGVPQMRVNLARLFFDRRGYDLNIDDLTRIIEEMESSHDENSS